MNQSLAKCQNTSVSLGVFLIGLINKPIPCLLSKYQRIIGGISNWPHKETNPLPYCQNTGVSSGVFLIGLINKPINCLIVKIPAYFWMYFNLTLK